MNDSPAIADCLAKSYIAVGRYEDAERVLTEADSSPVQAETYLSIYDAKGDAEALERALARLGGHLQPVDQKYFGGRLKELQRDPEAAIAMYDEAHAYGRMT